MSTTVGIGRRLRHGLRRVRAEVRHGAERFASRARRVADTAAGIARERAPRVRGLLATTRTGVILVAAGAALGVVAVSISLAGGGPGNPLSLRVLGPPPVPLVAADKPVSTSSPPVEVTIPAISVSSTLEGLHLQADGSLQTPTDVARVGWFADGPAPGDQGAAVFVGHLDSATGPAVFYRLAGLLRGDRIYVKRADGRTLTFVVDRSMAYPRTNLPVSAVYSAPGTELHLLTCDGTYDQGVGRYNQSLLVVAKLAADSSPAAPTPPQPGSQSDGSGGPAPDGGSGATNGARPTAPPAQPPAPASGAPPPGPAPHPSPPATPPPILPLPPPPPLGTSPVKAASTR